MQCYNFPAFERDGDMVTYKLQRYYCSAICQVFGHLAVHSGMDDEGKATFAMRLVKCLVILQCCLG